MSVSLRVLALALVSAAPAFAQEAPVRSITVTGDGEASAPADMATVRVGVHIEAASSGEAMDEASVSLNAMLATLEAAAIPAGDIQTGNINLSPRYAQNVLGSVDYSKIEGYSADNVLTVEVHDLNALGGLLSDLVAGGANTIDSVTFGLDDPTALTDEARRKAVAEARRRADLYADAAGVGVGQLIQLNENGFSGYMPMPMAADMGSFERSAPEYKVPLSPGMITVSANVSLVYAIAE